MNLWSVIFSFQSAKAWVGGLCGALLTYLIDSGFIDAVVGSADLSPGLVGVLTAILTWLVPNRGYRYRAEDV